MGLRYRKSKSVGPVRVTASKSGIGVSAGVKGFRVTKKAGGGIRTTSSIPGTGISYVKDFSTSRKSSASYGTYGSAPVVQAALAASVPADPRTKRCKTAFWVCLVLGIFFLPNVAYLGVPLLAGAVYFFIRKKKITNAVKQQEADAATEVVAKQRADQEARQARIAAADAEWQRFLDENELVRTIHTKVAGVTFRNSDGSSRQENLSYCISGGNVEFEHFTYQGAPAYSVSCGGLQIGNLPADLSRDLYELDDSYTFVGEIDEVTGGEYGLKYGCNLRIELYRHK